MIAGGLTVAVATLLVNAARVSQDLVVAYRYGVSDEVDAFVMAWLLPAFLLNVVAESFSAALIPVYMRVRERDGQPAAAQLLAGATVWTTGVTFGLSVLVAAASGPILHRLGPSFDPAKLALTQRLFLVMIPVLVLNATATIWGAVLNADHRYASAALSGVIVPLTAVVSLVVFGARFGIMALAVGTVLGYFAKCVWMGIELQRRGISIRPAWRGFTPDLYSMAGQFVPTVAASFLMTSTLIVDQVMAAGLGPGNLAQLVYGSKAVAFALSIGSLSMGAALLPHFSSLAARGEWPQFIRSRRTYTWAILALTIPATVLLFFASPFLVRIFFQRGAFTPADTVVVAHVQAMFGLQIPFFLVSILFVRMITSLQRTSILLRGTVISVVVNVALNYLFMRRLGVAGIALSTACVYVASASYLGYMLSRELRQRMAAEGATLRAGVESEGAAALRFGFGRNWRNFLEVLDEERIREAEVSLRDMLGVEHLRGCSFLDVGCGSGLFSLAAARLGARRVHSFDSDPDSVACARELKLRFLNDASEWTIQVASVLDRNALATLGTWDVVYSWGVLHHTGAMWTAIDNVVPLVAPGGTLFISLYNDQGLASRFWAVIKRWYNTSRTGSAIIRAVFLPAFALRTAVGDIVRMRNPLRRYEQLRQARGMSLVHDWIDWLGGYPFEVATSSAVVDYLSARGLQPSRVALRQTWGCNEFVLHAPSIESSHHGSASI